MSYIDGFVAAVPTASRATYLEFARATAAVFRECGALQCVDCWGDDVPDGKLTSDMKMPFDGARMIFGGFDKIHEA